jgi:hypothetical protein
MVATAEKPLKASPTETQNRLDSLQHNFEIALKEMQEKSYTQKANEESRLAKMKVSEQEAKQGLAEAHEKIAQENIDTNLQCSQILTTARQDVTKMDAENKFVLESAKSSKPLSQTLYSLPPNFTIVLKDGEVACHLSIFPEHSLFYGLNFESPKVDLSSNAHLTCKTMSLCLDLLHGKRKFDDVDELDLVPLFHLTTYCNFEELNKKCSEKLVVVNYNKNFDKILLQVLDSEHPHTLPLAFRKFLTVHHDIKTQLTPTQKQQFINMLKTKDATLLGYACFLESMTESRRLTNSETFALEAFKELSKNVEKVSELPEKILCISERRYENDKYLAERDKVKALMLEGLRCFHGIKKETVEENALSCFKKAFTYNSTEAYFELANFFRHGAEWQKNSSLVKKFLIYAAENSVIMENPATQNRIGTLIYHYRDQLSDNEKVLLKGILVSSINNGKDRLRNDSIDYLYRLYGTDCNLPTVYIELRERKLKEAADVVRSYRNFQPRQHLRCE